MHQLLIVHVLFLDAVNGQNVPACSPALVEALTELLNGQNLPAGSSALQAVIELLGTATTATDASASMSATGKGQNYTYF